ncbi:MAG: MFS transporter [Pelagibacterales bacterium]|nr:MFS transporter [Pelagibacterales bacterium]
MFHFWLKKDDVISRSYDLKSKDFVSFPDQNYAEKEAPEFRWSIALAKDILAVFSSIFIAAIGYGIMSVMIAFKMEEYVKNEILISLSSGTQIISGIILSRFLPTLGRKLGLTNSIYFGTTLSALTGFLMYFYAGYFVWLATIFIFGAASFLCGVVRQTITIDLAPKHIRATIISISGMLFSIGNSLGPVFLKITNSSDLLNSHLSACAFLLVSMIPLYRIKRIEMTVKEDKKIGLWRYIKNSPKIMFAGFCVNYSLSSCTAFIVIYGIKSGMKPTEASLLLSTLLFGAIFSIPIGYLTDLINCRFLMIVSGIFALTCSQVIYYNEDPNNLHLLIFLMFGSLIGIKLPAFVLINEKYKPTQRLAVNSAFGKISLLGNIFGIFCTGAIMKSFGPQALWASIAISIFLFLVFCNFNYLFKAIKKELILKDFYLLNKNKKYEEPL